MRRIFTSILSVALLMAVVKVNAQSCSQGTNPGSYSPVFSASSLSASGFTFSGNAQANLFRSGSNTMSTPIFYYNEAQLSIPFSITLRSTKNNGTTTINSFSITVSYGNATTPLTISCSNGTPFEVNNTAGGTIYYFSVPGNMAASTNFKIAFSATLPNGASDLELLSFSSNAIGAGNNAVLPVKFGSFTAKPSASVVNLNWTIDAEENTKGYEIERSADGRSYASIGSVAATGSRTYSFTDASPMASAHYRIKALDNDGKYGYSIVVRVKGNESAVDVKAFFANHNSLTIQHDMAASGSRITVTSADGKVLRTLAVAAGAQQTLVDVSAARPGLMLVRFESPKGRVETIKVVKP
jgi:hypothetical protein